MSVSLLTDAVKHESSFRLLTDTHAGQVANLFCAPANPAFMGQDMSSSMGYRVKA